jgi:hypothetical protein
MEASLAMAVDPTAIQRPLRSRPRVSWSILQDHGPFRDRRQESRSLRPLLQAQRSVRGRAQVGVQGGGGRESLPATRMEGVLERRGHSSVRSQKPRNVPRLSERAIRVGLARLGESTSLMVRASAHFSPDATF